MQDEEEETTEKKNRLQSEGGEGGDATSLLSLQCASLSACISLFLLLFSFKCLTLSVRSFGSVA